MPINPISVALHDQERSVDFQLGQVIALIKLICGLPDFNLWSHARMFDGRHAIPVYGISGVQEQHSLTVKGGLAEEGPRTSEASGQGMLAAQQRTLLLDACKMSSSDLPGTLPPKDPYFEEPPCMFCITKKDWRICVSIAKHSGEVCHIFSSCWGFFCPAARAHQEAGQGIQITAAWVALSQSDW